MTGLDSDSAEKPQVVSYGTGGHYEPHVDYFGTLADSKWNDLYANYGDRMATLLLYLNAVKSGGATVFPHLGISLWPQKGSAVFWYNLFQNGEGDDLTEHAACPVLTGSKWVSNFWIRERGQEFIRPCNTDQFI